MSYKTNSLAVAQDTIKQAHVDMENGAALERLKNNRDFQLVVGELFLRNEMLRIASLLGSHKLHNPNQTQAEVRENLVRDLHAKATLESFFDSIERKANSANQSIVQANIDIAALNGDTDDNLLMNGEDEVGDGGY